MHIHAAKQAGVKLAISTDTHSVDGFEYIRFGVDQARRGWLTADDGTARRFAENVAPMSGAREAISP